LLLRPQERVGIAAFASEEERPKLAEIVAADVLALRIVAVDGPKRRWSGEECADSVLRDHPPERAWVRSADRFSFVKNGRASVKQRRVDDVGVPDHPADVRRCPVHLAR